MRGTVAAFALTGVSDRDVLEACVEMDHGIGSTPA